MNHYKSQLLACDFMTVETLFETSATPVLAQSCFNQIQQLKQQRFGGNVPDQAKSDGPNQLVLAELPNLLWTLKRLWEATR